MSTELVWGISVNLLFVAGLAGTVYGVMRLRREIWGPSQGWGPIRGKR